MTDRMDEIDQPLPFALLRLVPESEAARSDARFGRHAGHLREYEAGAPIARAPRCAIWKSLISPSFAEYIAIGETTMRLASERPRTR